MPPAQRKRCDFPGCSSGEQDLDGNAGPYITAEGLALRAEVTADLLQHVKIAHELPLQHLQAQRDAHAAEAGLRKAEAEKIREERGPPPEPTEPAPPLPARSTPKVEPLPRPKIDEGSTESDWSFFKQQWVRYTKGTNITGEQAILQLWAACSPVLQRSLHNSGAAKILESDKLLDIIQTIAVKRRNNLVNVVEFTGIGQHRDEKINAFAARLNGKADLCDLTVDCHRPGCNTAVSFKDKLMMYQLLRGLSDTDIQARIFQNAAQVEGGEMSLNRVLKLAEALEAGKANQELVTGAGQLYRMSDHQHKKNSGRQDRRQPADKQQSKPNSKPSSPSACGSCGSKKHTSKLSDRRESCPAFQETCSACDTVGHFKAQCRGGPKDKSRDRRRSTRGSLAETKGSEPAPASPEGELGGLGGWFLLTGTQCVSPPYESQMCVSPSYESQVCVSPPYESQVCVSPPYESSAASTGNLASLKSMKKVEHQSFVNGKWIPSKLEDHGRVPLVLQLCSGVATSQGFHEPKHTTHTRVSGLADTGAQMCVSGTQVAERMGIRRSDLLKPRLKISVADNSGLELAGAAFVTITGPGGQSNQLVYFADNVDDFFLSKAACMDLNIIPQQFPAPAERSPVLHPPTSPPGLGNLGGFPPNSGVYSMSSLSSTTNTHPQHVQLQPAQHQALDAQGLQQYHQPHHGAAHQHRAPQDPCRYPLEADYSVNPKRNARVGTYEPSAADAVGQVPAGSNQQYMTPGPAAQGVLHSSPPSRQGHSQENGQDQLHPLTDHGVRNLGGSNYIPGNPVIPAVNPPNPAFHNVSMRDLGPEEYLERQTGAVRSVDAKELNQQQAQVKKDARGRVLAPCGCLLRTLPPDPPTKPPFPIHKNNTQEIRAWILDFYASSAFNTCPHQPLPLMSGLPPHHPYQTRGGAFSHP